MCKKSCMVYLLHTNEHPLRDVILNLDGLTFSNYTFSGAVSFSYGDQKYFEPICVGSPMIAISGEIIKYFSTDQHYGYRIVTAIQK